MGGRPGRRDEYVVGTIVTRLAPDTGSLDERWENGPLPLPWGDDVTSADLRSTYLAFRASQVLYPPEDRRHRFMDEVIAKGPDGVVTAQAVERLDVRSEGSEAGTSLGVLHVVAHGDDPVVALVALIRPPAYGPGATAAADAASDLWGSETLWRGQRVGGALLLVPGEGVVRDPKLASWAVAALSTVPPDRNDPDFTALVPLSATWSAHVLRDGMGFVWTGDRDDSFLPQAEVLARTVYTDVALLAAVQRAELEELADSLAAMDHRSERPDDLDRLADRVTSFRNRLWWDDVSTYGRGNQLLRTCQEQLGTPALFDRVTADLDAFRTEVETRLLRDAQLIQERAEVERGRFQRLVEVVGGGYAGATLSVALVGAVGGASVAGGLAWGTVGGAGGVVLVSAGSWILRRIAGVGRRQSTREGL